MPNTHLLLAVLVGAKTPLSVAATPSSVVVNEPVCPADEDVEAFPFGGLPPYTYLWSFLSGGAGITLSNATSKTCNVRVNAATGTKTGTLRCRVTDVDGAQATIDVPLNMECGGL